MNRMLTEAEKLVHDTKSVLQRIKGTLVKQDNPALQNHRKFERETLGMTYTMIDELDVQEKKEIVASSEPVKSAMHEIIKTMPYAPFGTPDITDTTKYDGNLAQSLNTKLKEDNAKSPATKVWEINKPGKYEFDGTVTWKSIAKALRNVEVV